MTTAAQAVVAYPNVKKWLIAGCNDNGVLGVVRALEQSGYTADDMIGVGVNGQIACEEFKKPEVTGLQGVDLRRLGDPRRHGDPGTLRPRHQERADPGAHHHRGNADHEDRQRKAVRQELSRKTPRVSPGPGGARPDGESMTAPAPQLELTNITKVFPNVRALDGVSIDVRPGEILALMGENGAGKSTLLKVMTGAYQLDGGEIRLGGTPVQISSPIASRRLGIRVAYQEPDIVGGVTVAENLFLGELPRRSGRVVDWRKLNEDTEALLAPFRLGPDLASGNAGRAALARPAADDRDPAGLAGGSEGARARRADLVALGFGHRGSLCADRAAEGPRRRPRSTSRTGCRKSSASPTGCRCCATERWSGRVPRRSWTTRP